MTRAWLGQPRFETLVELEQHYEDLTVRYAEKSGTTAYSLHHAGVIFETVWETVLKGIADANTDDEILDQIIASWDRYETRTTFPLPIALAIAITILRHERTQVFLHKRRRA